MDEADATGSLSESYLHLRERIVASFPDLSPRLRSIAEFALSNPDRMAVETAGQLAARLGVPASGIVRFAQAMGYSGFLEMKRTFSEHLMYRAQSLETPQPVAEDPAGWITHEIAEARRSLASLEHEANPETFEMAVQALDTPGQLYVTAQHMAHAVACIFAWRLLQGGCQCIQLDNVGGMALRQSHMARPEDVTLAMSFSPYQPSVVEAAMSHHGKGGTVVVITDTELSPLVPHADVLLVVAASSNGKDVLAGPVALACALADALIDRTRSRTSAL
ncbi:MAG: MurR/RpiR family transcriptional regulator [Proteobacteria bacterium]|nr:MurR/RpiR family transcriptional regulator [Pseudomonadota bacterium]